MIGSLWDADSMRAELDKLEADLAEARAAREALADVVRADRLMRWNGWDWAVFVLMLLSVGMLAGAMLARHGVSLEDAEHRAACVCAGGQP